VISEDLGGPWPRKVMFHPQSGRVKLKRLEMTGMAQIEKEEEAYLKDVTQHADAPDPGSVELF
jgi:chemotaxis protein CheD